MYSVCACAAWCAVCVCVVRLSLCVMAGDVVIFTVLVSVCV